MSATNGHAPKPISEQLRETRQAVRLERARQELVSLRAANYSAVRALSEGYDGYSGYSWGDLVDPMDAFRDADLQSGFPFLDRGYARRDGYNRPFLWSDLDLDLTRSTARWLATKNQLAIGALGNLRNYTVKTGFKYDAKPKEGVADPIAPVLAEQVNRCLKEFHQINQWPQRERSAFWRSRRDGEVMIRHFPQRDGCTWVRFVEPETVYKPLGSPMDWTWGIRTDPDDIERKLEYAVHYHGPDMDIDFVKEDCDDLPSSEAGMTMLALNVDECVKRGLSDFYCTGESLDLVKKLLRNLGVAGGIQAAIPWIEQFEQANAATVQAQVQQARDQNRVYNNQPVTGKPINFQKYEPGSILKVGKGKTYVPAPQPAGASIHIQIVQAGLRSVGARWQMPEYMISGDSSNANYASTLVSGSPFVNAIECEQSVYVVFFLRSQWIAVRNAARAGRFRIGDRKFTFEEIKRLVDIHCTPPQVAIANKQEEASIDHEDMDRGVLSIQTRREKLGLDGTKEDQNLREKPLPQPGSAASGAPGASPAGGGLGGLFGEARTLEGRLAELRERYGADGMRDVMTRVVKLLEDQQGGGFSGVDANGHKWVNGKQVKKGEGGGGSDDAGGGQGGAGQGFAAAALGKARAILAGAAKLGVKTAQGAGRLVAGKYKKLRDEFGHGGAIAILGASVALVPVPVPGAAMAPVLLAKGIKALHGRLTGKTPAVNESREQLPELAELLPAVKALLAEVYHEAGETMPDVSDADIAAALKPYLAQPARESKKPVVIKTEYHRDDRGLVSGKTETRLEE